MKKCLVLGLFVLAAGGSALLTTGCASAGDEPTVVPKAKQRLAKASILPGLGQDIPRERDGVSADDTGPIMWICSNSGKHEDKEVLIARCPECSQANYFYFDYNETAFRCYACLKLMDSGKIRCPECGAAPRRIRTKNVAKPAQ
jgi:Zn finger protein HypA/HybF involved in hydrogenase expression